MTISEAIDNTIREVPDFPKKGIMFKDITPILKDVDLSKQITEAFVSELGSMEIDAVVGIESRGFLFGMALAHSLGVPFCMVRKKGKLPGDTIEHAYDLEYGQAIIEMHKDALEKDWNVLVHDDLLATGGTACAAAELINKLEANVIGFAFLVELSFLKGKDRLENYSNNIVSLKTY
ncbi:MAG: adenine phosphoribosyltransferase [Flavobacteriales bacterium]|nr:adenine phosphoribosyltransferase [Flavobacteriales bacterium]